MHILLFLPARSPLTEAINEIQYSDLSCVEREGSRDEKVLSFNVAIDGDKGGGEDGTRRNVCGAHLVSVYASGRLYIALEAREGAISVSFDKKKQTLFAGRTCPVSKTHLSARFVVVCIRRVTDTPRFRRTTGEPARFLLTEFKCKAANDSSR